MIPEAIYFQLAHGNKQGRKATPFQNVVLHVHLKQSQEEHVI